MLKRVISRFSVENFCVPQYLNISLRNPSMLCFRKFLIAKKFMDKREGEVSRFSFEIFLSHSSEKFVGEPFRVSLISGIKKFYYSEGYITIFRRKFLCPTVPEHFVEETIYAVFQKNSESEKVYG